MNIKKILSAAAAFLFSFAYAAEVTVSDVVIKQLWPWSSDVDISFTVEGGNTAVKFTAQYAGKEPYVIPEGELSGDFLDASPGRCHVRWNLKRAGLNDKTLFNLKITAEPDLTDRTYMILNLADGSYRFAANPPDGGWLSDKAYYQTNMVFRRIPKGEGTLGLPKGLRDLIGFPSTESYPKTHKVTHSSDYYLAIFPITSAQHDFVVRMTKDVSGYSAEIPDDSFSYNDIRGSQSDNIDWPNTKYSVDDGSIVAKFRKVAEKTFSPDWHIDLPTVAQWEYAARATTPTNQLYSSGGKEGESLAAVTNYIDKIATWSHNNSSNRLVGQQDPNGWGIYDMIGLCYEWNLDWYANSTAYYSGVDPVGPPSGSWRTRRSASTASNTSLKFLTTAGIGTNGANSKHYYRLCIHLKSLFR